MRSQVLMASSRTFFCECFVLLCVFSLPHIANLEESTRKAISSFQTTTGSTGKYTVLYDYENKIVVYKDLINQKCVLEVVQGDESFINTWIAQQSYGGNSQDLNTENDQLPKRELWYLAKHRIIDFCKGLPTFYLQKRANLNRPTYFTNEVEENIIGRWKRQTTHYFKGRVRGQTQSQYLNFGKSDGDGKAEAESTVEGSKAVVSGQNGIGQAQSQSIPFGCDECYEQEQTVELGRRGEKYPEPIVQRPVGPPVPGQGGRPGVYLRPGQVEGGQFPGQPWVPGGVSGVGGIPGQVRGVPGQEIPGQVPGRGPQQTWQPGQAWPPGPAPSAPSQERGQPPGQVAGPTGQLWPPGQVPSQPGGPDQTQLGRTSGQTWIPGQAPGQARGPTGQFWQPGQVPNQTGGPAPIEGGIPSGQAWAPGQVPSQTPGQTWIPGQVPGQIGGPSEQVWTPGQVGGPGQTQTGRAPGQTWVPGRGPGEFDIPGQAWLPGQIPGQIGVPGQVTGPSGQVWIPGQPPSQVPGQTWIPGQIPSAPGQITSVSGQPWTPGGQVAPPGQPGQIRVPGQVGGPSWTPAQVPGSIPSPGQVGIPGQPTWQGSGTQVLAGERDSGRFGGNLEGNYQSNLGHAGRFSGQFHGQYESYGESGGRIQVTGAHFPGGQEPGVWSSPPDTTIGRPGVPGWPSSAPGAPSWPGAPPSGQGFLPGPIPPGAGPGWAGVSPAGPTIPGAQGISGGEAPGGIAVELPGASRPGGYVGVPGGSTGFPGSTISVPGAISAAPGGTSGRPQGTQVYPGGFPGGYPGAQGVPVVGFPGGIPGHPGVSVGYPGGLTGYPGVSGGPHGAVPGGYPSGIPGVPSGAAWPSGPQGPWQAGPSGPQRGPGGTWPGSQITGVLQSPAGAWPGGQIPGSAQGPASQAGWSEVQIPGGSQVPSSQVAWPGGQISGGSQAPGSQGAWPGGQIPGVPGIPGAPSGVPQQYTAPGVRGTVGAGQVDDSDSQVQTSVLQIENGTTAQAQAQGIYAGGTAQSQVSGTYSGSGSFSASAGSDDGKRGAMTQVAGGKDGAQSSAQGRGGSGTSQSQVVLSSGTGNTLSSAQSSGLAHGTQSQVEASEKGGLADAQANGSGNTSSQAQIGFTPYQEEDDDNQTTTFRGGGTAGAQSGSLSGMTQAQVQGKFRYGIRYTGGAQASSGISFGKNSSEGPFKPLDLHFDTPVSSRNKGYSQSQTSKTSLTAKRSGETTTSSSTSQPITTVEAVAVPQKSTNTQHDSTEYDDDDDYEDYEEEPPKPATRNIISQVDTHQKQHIILDPLKDMDVTVTQSKGSFPPDGTVIGPGENIPGSPGYRIPLGFRGTVKSMANGKNTYAIGRNSQAQSVTLSPGTGKIIYTRPIYAVTSNTQSRNGQYGYGSGYTFQPAYQPVKYQFKNGKTLPDFVSVTKSETGSKNLVTGKKTPSVSYTQSSTCGIFINHCVYNAGKKLCFPKAKTNPDGTIMGC